METTKVRWPGLAPFCQNLLVDPRTLGLETNLISMVRFASSQRVTMFNSSHAKQALVIDGCEPFKIQSGSETRVGKYQFDETKRDQEIQILKIIPKFYTGIGAEHITQNPSSTVVYVGLDDGIVSYFNLNSYANLYDSFGYENKVVDFLRSNTIVPKEAILSSTPNKSGNIYMPGTNANIAYMTINEVNNDAVVIGKSFAKKLTHTMVESITINVPIDHIPLNLYGDDEVYKIWPEIGEKIGDHGILCGFRPKSNSFYELDLTRDNLSKPNRLHDALYHRGHPGAEIADIQIYINGDKYNKIKKDDVIHSQIIKYQEQHLRYYNDLIDIYDKVDASGRDISDKLSSLLVKCYGYTNRDRIAKEKIKLTSKRESIDKVRVTITYKWKRAATVGDKITGCEGAKSIISAIWEDEHMPYDALGFKTDMIASPMGPFNRLNFGQYYAPAINRTSDLIHKRLLAGELGLDDQAYEYIMKYIRTMNPNYAERMEHVMYSKEEALGEIKEEGIFLVLPPFLETIGLELMDYIQKEYNVEELPVTYSKVFPGGKVRTYTTKKPVLIGSKSIYLLGKPPMSQLSAVSMGYVSQFGFPVRVESKDLKNQYPHMQTTQRLGEDEVAILSMGMNPKVVQRLLATHANCPEATNQVLSHLLTDENPLGLERIPMSTDEMQAKSINVALFLHMVGAVGAELTKTELQA